MGLPSPAAILKGPQCWSYVTLFLLIVTSVAPLPKRFCGRYPPAGMSLSGPFSLSTAILNAAPFVASDSLDPPTSSHRYGQTWLTSTAPLPPAMRRLVRLDCCGLRRPMKSPCVSELDSTVSIPNKCSIKPRSHAPVTPGDPGLRLFPAVPGREGEEVPGGGHEGSRGHV
jgi:hypothetical protein